MAVVAVEDDRGRVSAGRRRAEKQQGPNRKPLLLLLGVGAVAALVAWFFLVRAAVDFGRVARAGESLAWAFTGAATLGAALCLLLVFVLLARVLNAVGIVSDYKPRRSAGKRTR